ncbi:MAG TPA: hypothetical protein VFR98_02670, partial [Agromyces sp.]|nr:hypothetical protein [Agromyces sp.]
PYALSIMFVLVAVLALDVAMQRGGRRAAWVVAAIAGALAVAMHLFAIFALATTAVLLVGRRRSVGAWLLAGIPTVAVAVAIGLVALGQSGQLTWLSAPDGREAIAILANVAAVATDRAVLLDAALLAVVVVMLALVVAVTARTGGPGRWDRLRPVLFSATLLGAPWFVLSIGSWTLSPMLTDRYVLWSAAGAALSIGAGVHRCGRPRGRAPRPVGDVLGRGDGTARAAPGRARPRRRRVAAPRRTRRPARSRPAVLGGRHRRRVRLRRRRRGVRR